MSVAPNRTEFDDSSVVKSSDRIWVLLRNKTMHKSDGI